MESCPTQAVLPLVGLAAEKVLRERYIPAAGRISRSLPPRGRCKRKPVSLPAVRFF
ncbi:MAG: hypothetical protein R6U98_12985 [Pirellulaceae bacterium]